jgi:hypothetical protein
LFFRLIAVGLRPIDRHPTPACPARRAGVQATGRYRDVKNAVVSIRRIAARLAATWFQPC